MKLRVSLIILFFILICLFPCSLKSQLSNSVPRYAVQITVGFNKAVLELSGKDYISENIYEGKTFGADRGFGASVYSKLRLGKQSNFTFIQGFSYNRFFSYDFGKFQYDIGEANYNAFTLSMGIEYDFSPVSNYKIYIGPELNGSIINGDAVVWFEHLGSLLGDSVASYKFNSSFRIGFGVNIGALYWINKSTALNIGTRYFNLNLLLKNADGIKEDNEFKIRDAVNKDLIFSGEKSFAFLSYYAGIIISF